MNPAKICILSLVVTVCIAICSGNKNVTTSTAVATTKTKNARINVGFKYHNYEEMTKLLKRIAKRYPRRTQLSSIGKSVEGRELWVMHITE